MSTMRLISVAHLLAFCLIALSEVVSSSAVSSSLWHRSLRMQVTPDPQGSLSSVPATSVLQCLRVCLLRPVCDNVCFLLSSNACFADNNITMSSSASYNPDLMCYMRDDSCSVTRGYSLVNGTCAKVHVTSPLLTNYSVAANTCSGEGGHLFDVKTSKDTAALNLLLDQADSLPSYPFVGARVSEGQFYWTDGSAADTIPWDMGQPNAPGTENCLAISASTRMMHDISCQQVYAFVCQIDM